MHPLVRCVLAAIFAASGVAHAQTGAQWPAQPIRLIVPFPPGGTTDLIARLIQPQLQKSLGVSVVVDNRGGASGAIGAGIAAKSPPDGHTFLVVFDTHAVNPSLIPNMTFDTLKDLAPMMLIGNSPMVVTAFPTFPYKTFADVLKLARAQPGAVSYGTIGSGSLAHLAMTVIGNQRNVQMTHVPYKGGGPLIVGAIGGEIPLAMASLALLSPNIQAKKLRAIGLTSANRHPQYPELQTIAEQGVPGFAVDTWWGLHAPANTPPAIIARMNGEVIKALKVPSVQQQLDLQSLNVIASSPEEYGRFLANEVARWGKVVRENKIRAGD